MAKDRRGEGGAVTTHVVLVRPWADAQAGSGCCSGDTREAIALDAPVCRVHETPAEAQVVGRTYRLLRERLPDVDTQIVSASNTAYLLPTTYRAARRRLGRAGALREASRATTAGAVLVDGEMIGDIADLGPEGVLVAVGNRVTR